MADRFARYKGTERDKSWPEHSDMLLQLARTWLSTPNTKPLITWPPRRMPAPSQPSAVLYLNECMDVGGIGGGLCSEW